MVKLECHLLVLSMLFLHLIKHNKQTSIIKMKKYQGNVSKFKKFISEWINKKGEKPHEIKEINQEKYKQALDSGLPKSYVDFYFSMNSFECQNILRIEADDEESSIRLIDIDEVINNYKSRDLSLKSPTAFNDKNYKIYSKNQEEMSPYVPLDDYMQLLLIGEYNDIVFQGKILLNNFIKFDDRELEAIFIEIGGAYEVRCTSFAELVVWFYLNDPVSGVELDSLYADHLDDSSELSSILFK